MSRLEKDQSGIELMNSVKGEFVNLSEELTDDAVSIEDIDEVLQTLELHSFPTRRSSDLDRKSVV